MIPARAWPRSVEDVFCVPFDLFGLAMETRKLADLVEVFEGLKDWRSAQQMRHQLSDDGSGR